MELASRDHFFDAPFDELVDVLEQNVSALGGRNATLRIYFVCFRLLLYCVSYCTFVLCCV